MNGQRETDRGAATLGATDAKIDEVTALSRRVQQLSDDNRQRFYQTIARYEEARRGALKDPFRDAARGEQTQMPHPVDECGPGCGSSPPRSAVNLHGIGWAIKQMHNGACVSRRGWNGPGQYLQLQVPDSHSKMSLSYIYITTAQGERVPWLASQTDLLARDWFVR